MTTRLASRLEAGHIYWANVATNTIGRASLDGSDAQPGFISGASSPIGVAVDAGHVYWANATTDTIGRANLDGSGADQSFIGGLDNPAGIAVGAGHVYWANFDRYTIGRANLDGTAADQSFIRGADGPLGVAVGAGHVYWVNFNTRAIGRANLDGSGADRTFITGARGPYGVAVDSLKPPKTKLESAAIHPRNRKARFRFSSSQPGSSFRCSLDGRAFKSCSSPKTFRNLTKGRHTFRVKARNAQGALDPSPAKRTFRI